MSTNHVSLGPISIQAESWTAEQTVIRDEQLSPPQPNRAPAIYGLLAGWSRGAMADLGAAIVVASCMAPIVATLATAVLYAHSGQMAVVGNTTNPIFAALVNLAVAWLLVAVPCSWFGLGRGGNVNRSAFEKLENRVAELRAWVNVTTGPAGASCGEDQARCCRTIAHRAIATHVDRVERSLKQRGIAWVLGTGYIALWRRLNAAEAQLPYLEPLDQVRLRADRLSSRLAESSLPGAAAMEAGLGQARRTLCTHEARDEGEVRALIGQVQFAIDDFRTDRYAGLVQARNLLLGTSGVAGAALYATVWLTLAPALDGARALEWGIAFYLVGALVGILNVLYVQAGIDSSVEDYSLSTARVLVAPQLAGIAALLGVLITATTAMTQGGGTGDTVAQFGRVLNFLPAAGFALSPGVVLSGLRKRTEDIKQDLKTSRALGHRAT